MGIRVKLPARKPNLEVDDDGGWGGGDDDPVMREQTTNFPGRVSPGLGTSAVRYLQIEEGTAGGAWVVRDNLVFL